MAGSNADPHLASIHRRRGVLLAIALPLMLLSGLAVAREVVEQRGSVVWRADAESPLEEEWASLSTHTNCGTPSSEGMVDERFRRVDSPVAQGGAAYHSHLRDGDDCYGERSETGQGNPIRAGFSEDRLFREGDERWISWQMQLGASFPIETDTWQVVAQWKQLGGLGVPILSLEARAGQWRFYANAPEDVRMFELGPAALERWTRFTLHVKFSPHPETGFVELHGDLADGQGMRELIARTHVSTLRTDPDRGDETVPSHARLGVYRDSWVSEPADVYYDGYTVATTRSAAEDNAF